MLHNQLSKNLKPGETLIRAIHRDLISMIAPLAVASMLIVLDFFLITFFLRFRIWGIVVFAVVFLVGLITILRSVIEWKMNSMLLTNERIIHVYQKGFFTRIVSETTYDRVTDVRSQVKGFLQTALDFGAVEVQTAGEGENMRLVGVRHPPQVQAQLTTILRDSTRLTRTPLSAEELAAVLSKAQHELGPEAFHKAVSEAMPQTKTSKK